MKLTLPLILCLLTLCACSSKQSPEQRDEILADSIRAYMYRQYTANPLKIDSIVLLRTEPISREVALHSLATQLYIDLLNANGRASVDTAMLKMHEENLDRYMLIAPYANPHSSKVTIAEYTAKINEQKAILHQHEQEAAQIKKYQDSIALLTADTAKKDCYGSIVRLVMSDNAHARSERNVCVFFDKNLTVVTASDIKEYQNP